MKFYNRTKELDELHRIQKLSFEGYSRFTVVTGRRRIGKTSLIVRACQDTPTVYLFVSRDNEAILVKHFAEEIRRTLDIFVLDGISTVRDLLTLLMEVAKDLRFNLIIDEFQDFLYVNRAIFSHIQDIWDRYHHQTHVNFIVCGSAYHLMNKIFEDNKEPLFGRRDCLLKLMPFEISVLKEILHDYNPSYTNEDLLALYTYTGGVPKYIELFMDDGAYDKDSMINYMIRDNSQFITEGRNIIVEEFGKDYGTYFSILGCISSGLNSQAVIENALGNISIGGNLKRLMEDYALITKIRPYASKEGTKTVRYAIKDNFLKFWFKYIHRNRSIVEIGNWELLKKIVKEDYNTYTGTILEEYFRQQLKESFNYREISNWWDPKNKENQCEIDIIAITADDKTAEIYEVKRNAERYQQEILEKKVSHLLTKVSSLKKYKRKIGCLSILNM